MSAKPKISVVLPTWNSANTLGNAVNSIRNQTFQDWELIIVDDGSIDNTKEVMSRFVDKKIKYFYKFHEGLVAARNYGNRKAKGELIVIQDSDDVSFPLRLQKIWDKYQDTNADVIVHGFYLNMWDEAFEAMHREYRGVDKLDKKRLLKEQYLPGYPAFKRGVWYDKPFRLETQYSYDWMMHLDWVFSGFSYQFINEPLYEYIRYNNSASVRFEKEGLRQQSFRKIKEIMKKEYGQN